jgi:hypothetical protein
MFVGFRLDEWDFRVLYNSLMRSEGRRRRRDMVFQIDPEEAAPLDAQRIPKYLEYYFHSARVSLYWGSTEHFAKELQDAWSARR